MKHSFLLAALLGTTIQASHAEVLQISYSGELSMNYSLAYTKPTEEELESAFDVEVDGDTISGIIYYDTMKTQAPWEFSVFGFTYYYNQIVQEVSGSHVSYRAENNATDLVAGAVNIPHLYNDDHLVLKDYSGSGGSDEIRIKDSISTNGPANSSSLNYLGTHLENTITIVSPSGQDLLSGVDLNNNLTVDQDVLDQSDVTVRLTYSDDNRATFAPRKRRIYANMEVAVTDISVDILASAPQDPSLMCTP